MAGSTIFGYTGPVTLGSHGNYLSPLSITGAGTVIGPSDGGPALYVGAGSVTATIDNAGRILAQGGGVGVEIFAPAVLSTEGSISGGAGNNQTGGDGIVVLGAATIYNFGSITGGGVYDVGAFSKFNGGIGILLDESGGVFNGGIIRGGYGSTGNEYAGNGGGGVLAIYDPGNVITNDGSIIGGSGGTSTLQGSGGAGGYGISINRADATNNGLVEGGAAGAAVYYRGHAGYAGAGVVIANGSLSNTGTILGGQGGAIPGAGASRYQAGAGGIGVQAAGSTITNYGTILGGTGGDIVTQGGTAGLGGDGVVLGSGQLTNTGIIIGGTGGFVTQAASYTAYGVPGGVGVQVGAGATLINSGTIIGGTGGDNIYTGASGGIAVSVTGGTFIDSGLVAGGPGGQSQGPAGPTGAAIYITGSVAGTLVLDPGAALEGYVYATGAADVLQLAGTSTTTLGGIGSNINGFSIVSFATGAQRIVAGSINSFGTVNGLAPHDVIVIDNYTAKLHQTTITANQIVLFNSQGGTTLDISTATAKDLILTDGNANTTIISASGTVAHVIGTNTEQFVLSGGNVLNTTIAGGGLEEIYSGGTAHALISGGTLELHAGGHISNGISFSAAKNGHLIIDSTTLPTATITNFIATDTIQLAGIVYNSSDKVTVATAGVVTIKTPKTNYSLNIAGAKPGATTFHFGPGSILTDSATTLASMTFLSPQPANPPHPAAADATVTGAATHFHIAPPLTQGPHGLFTPPTHPAPWPAAATMTLANHATIDFLALTKHLMT